LTATTSALGQILRRFAKKTCSAFRTKDLPSEEAARGRRKAAAALKKSTQVAKLGETRPENAGGPSTRRGTNTDIPIRGRNIGTATRGKTTGTSTKGKKAGASTRGKNTGTSTQGKKSPAQDDSAEKPKQTSQQCFFNLCTYKLHALGDYVANIWRYGTTDNYSTQSVKCCIVFYFTFNTY